MKSVLIIDDKEEIRSVVKTTLEQFGFAVHEASNGPDGIDMALTHVPDLIICDVVMGEMDGFKTLEAIRELALFATTPFILMTGSVGNDGFRRAMSCGADDYLQKPFQAEELIDAVVSRLVRHAQMRAAAETRAEHLRNLAVQQISNELSAPITGLLGLASTLRRESPSLDTERVFLNARRLSESVSRLGHMTEGYAA